MKKLITICLLLATAFTVNAQDMSFDETTKYIKENLIEHQFYFDGYPGCIIGDIEVLKNGKVNLIFKIEACGRKTINLFSKSNWNENKADGIVPHIYPNGRRVIAFGLTNDTKDLESNDADLVVLTRISKAFIYLRSLCKEEKDPFEN